MGNQTGRPVNDAQNILPRQSLENSPRDHQLDSPQVSIHEPTQISFQVISTMESYNVNN